MQGPWLQSQKVRERERDVHYVLIFVVILNIIKDIKKNTQNTIIGVTKYLQVSGLHTGLNFEIHKNKRKKSLIYWDINYNVY